MNSKNVLSVVLLLTIFMSGAIGETWSGQTRLKQLYPYAGGLIFLSDYANTSLSTCDGGTRFQIAKSHENYEVMVSTLMAAFMADKIISFNVDDQLATCMPSINRFMVVK